MMLYLLFIPFTLFLLIRTLHFVQNYIAARRLKLPIICLPVSFEDPWWLLIKPLFTWLPSLPFGLGDWYLYTDFGWPMIDGAKTTAKLGETFVLVSPGRNQICTVYPPAIDQVYRDMKTWYFPEPLSQTFTFFGQNVSSLNGPEWQRHRKITAQAFNESTMSYVWDESIDRVSTDLGFLANNASCSLANLRSDINVLAMHVLTSVGFGQDTALTDLPAGHRLTLLESLNFILKNIFTAVLFSGLQAPDHLLPPPLRRLKVAVSEFRLYMQESVLREIQSTHKSSKPSILRAMVAANEAEKTQQQQPQKLSVWPSFLTDSELYGNLFVFNLSGFETTAGTMSFALPYLAIFPDVQDWVRDEVDRYHTRSTTTNYHETYPKLIRCLALMYETLRIAGPAPQMVRANTVPTSLTISSGHASSSPVQRTIDIEPNTLVTADFYGVHLSPRWGPDARSFDPKRFVRTSSPSGSGDEILVTSPTSSSSDGDDSAAPLFMPWLFGPRVCPGKKFGQVEFVAVVAHILSMYRIELDTSVHGGIEAARSHLQTVLDDKYFNVSTHIKKPESASLRFVPRR